MNKHIRGIFSAVCCLTLSAIGCAAKVPTPVPCLVTLDDKPLPFVVLTLVPERPELLPTTVTTDEEGTCNLAVATQQHGLFAQTYKVLVIAPGNRQPPTPAPEDSKKADWPTLATVPAIYSDLQRTPLTVVVPSPTQPTVIALKSDVQ
jgi:hypothetical protein